VHIQIFGRKKCFDTKKAERYFRERNITFQFVDLAEKSISKGELQSIRATVGLNNITVFAPVTQASGNSQRPEVTVNRPDCFGVCPITFFYERFARRIKHMFVCAFCLPTVHDAYSILPMRYHTKR
jgi:glutaredoxin